MELTREVLEASAACDRLAAHGHCCVCIARHDCEASQRYAALALSLMDERDRLLMQVKAAEEVIAKAAAAITVETDEGLAALCAIQAWQITPTEMYYRNEAEMEAAR